MFAGWEDEIVTVRGMECQSRVFGTSTSGGRAFSSGLISTCRWIESGKIKDDTRIRRALPTIRYAIEQGAKSILTSHLGRPKGEKKPEMSLRPVAVHLETLLGLDVGFVDDCVGKQVQDAAASLTDGAVAFAGKPQISRGGDEERSEVCRRTCGSWRMCT